MKTLEAPSTRAARVTDENNKTAGILFERMPAVLFERPFVFKIGVTRPLRF
jgi:hypothetical protein